MATYYAKACEVREDDRLPGLGNGYVIDVERGDFLYPVQAGGQLCGYTEMVCITYSDQNCDENYLLLMPDSLLSIESEDDPSERGEDD